MLTPRQNRLLPIIAMLAVLLLILVAGRSCRDDAEENVLLDRVPQAAQPDADTPADTIKTLTANVAAMTAELEALRQANTRLKTDNESLRQDRRAIDETVSVRLERELTEREAAQRAQSEQAMASLNARIDALGEALSAANDTAGSDIPIGLGWDPALSRDLVWIEPLDGMAATSGNALLPAAGRGDNALTAAAGRTTSAGSAELQTDELPRPLYTVPRNATLIGSTAMTALLGRVPIRGEVRDPMPFKVITGRDNLAANGLTIPGVAGMVWSGTAIGDWTLSCVSGRLESVTFVFDDGRIRTISRDDRQQADERSGDRDRPLGWISDARGIPCVSGERKSNAAAFLSQRIGAKAIEAAARAAAAAETTTVIPGSGAITNSVTGDPGAYVLGETVAEGGEEIAQWLLERQAQSFDAVFVPAGAELAIHVDRALTIDYDPNGRRLNHAMQDASSARHDLD